MMIQIVELSQNETFKLSNENFKAFKFFFTLNDIVIINFLTCITVTYIEMFVATYITLTKLQIR